VPVVELQLHRAARWLHRLVRDDVAVLEREPEAAAPTTGLEVRTVLEVVAHAGGGADVELAALNTRAAPSRHENGAEDEEADQQHGHGCPDDDFDVTFALGVERHASSFGEGAGSLGRAARPVANVAFRSTAVTGERML